MYNTEYLFSLNFLRIESHASAFTELVNTLYAAVADGVDVADEGVAGCNKRPANRNKFYTSDKF